MTGCATVFIRDNGACDLIRNITVMAIYDVSGINNVTFFQPSVFVYIIGERNEISAYPESTSSTYSYIILLHVIL